MQASTRELVKMCMDACEIELKLFVPDVGRDSSVKKLFDEMLQVCLDELVLVEKD